MVCRCQRLGADAARKDILALGRLDAAGVDKHEIDAIPVGLVVGTVTGYATGLMDDSLMLLGYAVYQGRLAHIRATYDGNDGLWHRKAHFL